jgi:hypothetical protein
MTADDLNIRLIKIEQRMENLIRELNEDKLACRATHVKIYDSLEVLKSESSKNKGFFGGIVFAVSACFAVIVYALGKQP